MDFSLAAAMLIASSGRATSMSLRGDLIVCAITREMPPSIGGSQSKTETHRRRPFGSAHNVQQSHGLRPLAIRWLPDMASRHLVALFADMQRQRAQTPGVFPLHGDGPPGGVPPWGERFRRQRTRRIGAG